MNDKITYKAEPLQGASVKNDFSKNMETMMTILAVIILLTLIIKYTKRGQGGALSLGEVLPMLEG